MNDTLIKGKYQIIREIARSNDIVYEAQDVAFGRKIALKELNLAQGLTGSARRERIERFHREAKAAGKLSHPNIVSIFDYGEENGRYFIAMEFLEGQTLRDKIAARGAFTLPDAIEVASEILDALGYAHQRGVIHRDIKPDNIHILPGGQAKLTDFGIARISEEPQLTSNGQIFGTPSFMSPEQIVGGAIDHRSDLFSLGIVLYEMLAGRRPFVGDSVVSITYAIMNAEPPPISGLPYGLEQVLRRALAKSSLHRFNNAEEFRQALKAADQTPALFLNNNRSVTGAFPQGYPQQQQPPPMNNPGYGSVPQYGMPQQQPYPQQPPPMVQGYPPPTVVHGYPQQMPIPQLPPTMQQPIPQDGAPFGWNGQVPQQGQQPRPRKPRRTEPLIVLSPGAKSMINAVLAAIVLGSAIGAGVIWFQKAYQVNQAQQADNSAIILKKQGDAAYQAAQYQQALDFYTQALQAKPMKATESIIKTSMAYCYVNLAQIAKAKRDFSGAEKHYRDAIALDPNYTQASDQLAQMLRELGKIQESEQVSQRISSATPSRSDSQEATPNSAPPLSHPNSGINTPTFENNGDRAQQATRFANEGLSLEQKGDYSGAIEKYNKALDLPGGLDSTSRSTLRERVSQLRNSNNATNTNSP